MRRDEETFLHFEKNKTKGFVFRIYEWKSPTISLGISQDGSFLKKKLAIDVVKRITGGKAVLHHQEVTYSVVSDLENSLVGGNLKESYDRISCLLIDFLKTKIKNAEISQIDTSEKNSSPICYLTKGFKEICLNGKKIIGSAQKRGRHSFLQHGSIPCLRHELFLENYLFSNVRERPDYVFLEDHIDDFNLKQFKEEMKFFLMGRLF